MSARVIPLLLATRLRLTPRWLARRARRNAPGLIFTTGTAVIIAGLVALAAWSPPAACHLAATQRLGRPHWVCAAQP